MVFGTPEDPSQLPTVLPNGNTVFNDGATVMPNGVTILSNGQTITASIPSPAPVPSGSGIPPVIPTLPTSGVFSPGASNTALPSPSSTPANAQAQTANNFDLTDSDKLALGIGIPALFLVMAGIIMWKRK